MLGYFYKVSRNRKERGKRMKDAKERLSRKIVETAADGRPEGEPKEINLVVGLGRVGADLLQAVQQELGPAAQVRYLAVRAEQICAGCGPQANPPHPPVGTGGYKFKCEDRTTPSWDELPEPDGVYTVWVHLLAGMTADPNDECLPELADHLRKQLESVRLTDVTVLGWLALPQLMQPVGAAYCLARLQQLEQQVCLPGQSGRRSLDGLQLLDCPPDDPADLPQRHERLRQTVAQGIRFLVTGETVG